MSVSEHGYRTRAPEVRQTDYPAREWERRPALPAQRPGPLPQGSGWAVAGLALVGLGVLGWMYFGADLKRYMKIREM
jgi:hypothetical protein